MGITVDHIIGKRWFTVNFEVFLLRICHVLWPSKGHVFFFLNLSILMSWKSSVLHVKYRNIATIIFFSHFELTSMSFLGTITFWELEIPNSGCGRKPFCHPITVSAALPLRTVYIVYVQRCAYPWVLTFLCILIFFSSLAWGAFIAT